MNEMPDIPAFLDRRKPKALVYSYSLLNNYANVCPHQTWRRYVKKDQKFVPSAAKAIIPSAISKSAIVKLGLRKAMRSVVPRL